MLLKQIADAKNETHKIIRESKISYLSKGWPKLENFLEELESSLLDVNILDDCFDGFSVYHIRKSSKGDVDLVKAVITGKNYTIDLSTSEPDNDNRDYQKSKILEVKGFGIKNKDYNETDIEIFKTIADRAQCTFTVISPSFGKYDMRLQSGAINLQKNPDSISDIGAIINKIQKGTIACDTYMREREEQRQKYIRDTVNRLLG